MILFVPNQGKEIEQRNTELQPRFAPLICYFIRDGDQRTSKFLLNIIIYLLSLLTLLLSCLLKLVTFDVSQRPYDSQKTKTARYISLSRENNHSTRARITWLEGIATPSSSTRASTFDRLLVEHRLLVFSSTLKALSSRKSLSSQFSALCRMAHSFS